MWKKKHVRSKPGEKPQAVGTEAVAKANLERNVRNFAYPTAGFVHKIEYSLLYSMLQAPPRTYPNEAIASVINEEDFAQYLTVVAEHDDSEQGYSYSQLSAVLVLASENFTDPIVPSNERRTSDPDNAVNVPQVLCRALIRTVVRHAEEHDLDRATCVHELMQPLQRLASDKSANRTLLQVLPMYLGLGASLLTGNPLPMYLGYMGSGVMAVDNAKDLAKLQDLVNATDRAADVEKASLLDESDEH
jgi:hypothetical protein